jgi:hypothetical protein
MNTLLKGGIPLVTLILAFAFGGVEAAERLPKRPGPPAYNEGDTATHEVGHVRRNAHVAPSGTAQTDSTDMQGSNNRSTAGAGAKGGALHKAGSEKPLFEDLMDGTNIRTQPEGGTPGGVMLPIKPEAHPNAVPGSQAAEQAK